MKTKTRKELEENRNAWVIIAIVSFSLFAVYSIFYDNEVDDLKDQLSECQDKVPVYEIKCFQRVLRHDRIFDISENTILHGSYYNTTWHETECGKYDDYEVWTLRIECFNLRGRWIDQENYTKIDSCLHFRNVAESWGCKIIENCEVIE